MSGRSGRIVPAPRRTPTDEGGSDGQGGTVGAVPEVRRSADSDATPGERLHSVAVILAELERLVDSGELVADTAQGATIMAQIHAARFALEVVQDGL